MSIQSGRNEATKLMLARVVVGIVFVVIICALGLVHYYSTRVSLADSYRKFANFLIDGSTDSSKMAEKPEEYRLVQIARSKPEDIEAFFKEAQQYRGKYTEAIKRKGIDTDASVDVASFTKKAEEYIATGEYQKEGTDNSERGMIIQQNAYYSLLERYYQTIRPNANSIYQNYLSVDKSRQPQDYAEHFRNIANDPTLLYDTQFYYYLQRIALKGDLTVELVATMIEVVQLEIQKANYFIDHGCANNTEVKYDCGDVDSAEAARYDELIEAKSTKAYEIALDIARKTAEDSYKIAEFEIITNK